MTRALLVLSITLSLSVDLGAVPVLIGVPGSGSVQDCVPFGCAARAQFLYDKSYFADPLTIAAVTFFNSLDEDLFDPAAYQFKLSTTTTSLDSLSTTFADNVGTNEQTFTFANPTGTPAPAFSFIGTPFYYNPADGNLLLEIDKVGGDPNSADAYTDYNKASTFLVRRVFNFDNLAEGQFDDEETCPTLDCTRYGPVIEFTSFEDLQSIPEPATLTLTGLGLLALVRTAVRKRRNERVR